MAKRKITESTRWLTAFRSLTVASTKMYMRNYTALFFTLFFPILLIIVFGYLFKNNSFSTKIALTNYSQNQLAKQTVETLKKVEAFKITEMSESEARDQLGKGKIDSQIVIPEEFGAFDPATQQLKPAKLKSYYNEARPQQGTTNNLIIGQILAGINSGITKSPVLVSVDSQGVKTNNLGSIDFFLPGVIALSIMQLGIFSVAFGFIQYKSTGALRRLQATPVHPFAFVLGQGVARLVVAFVQIGLLLGLGMLIFGAKLVGPIWDFMLVATIGAIVFLGFGFAIAGWAKDENQAAPVAQLIQLPMLFLSGVFFTREGLPSFLQKVTDYLPLTFLSDALRKIANEGASLWSLRGDILGLIVWGVVVYFIAVRVFKWE